METLIHRSDGSLVSDLPWWQKEGKIIAVEEDTGARSVGVHKGTILTVTEECIRDNIRSLNMALAQARPLRVVVANDSNDDRIAVYIDAFEPVE